MESDIRVKFVDGVEWPEPWQKELAAQGFSPRNWQWRERELGERKPERERAIQGILAALQDYDVVDIEEGVYSDHCRIVLTRRPIKTLLIDFNELESLYNIHRSEGETYEEETNNDYQRIWKAVNQAFRYRLGETE